VTGLDKVKVSVAVELGHRTLRLGEVLGFSRGAALDLERPAEDQVTVVAAGVPVALARLVPRGDGPLAIEITRLLGQGAAPARDAA
jgi:flagellar motor switch/type III secretory pathway protein FliN